MDVNDDDGSDDDDDIDDREGDELITYLSAASRRAGSTADHPSSSYPFAAAPQVDYPSTYDAYQYHPNHPATTSAIHHPYPTPLEPGQTLMTSYMVATKPGDGMNFTPAYPTAAAAYPAPPSNMAPYEAEVVQLLQGKTTTTTTTKATKKKQANTPATKTKARKGSQQQQVQQQ